jgi:hypothetical protein
MNRIKTKSLLLACFIAVTGVCFAQNTVTQDSVQTLENAIRPATPYKRPSGKTILNDMKTNEPLMYLQYQSGKKMQRNGIILTSAGGGIVGAGAMFCMIEGMLGTYGDGRLLYTGLVFMGAGVVCLSVGVPVMITGVRKKKQTFRDFKNQYYLPPQPSSYFQMNIYPNRAGVAYVF